MTEHRTVLLPQAVDALVTDPAGRYVDGTFGRGGHSRLILERLSPRGRLLAIDRDPEAIAAARELAAADSRLAPRHASFGRLAELLDELGWRGGVNGVLLDLGVSSPQLDAAARGFSFTKDGPLDMRMNPQEGISAGEWLASAPEQEIARVLYEYGEERFSRRMARAVVEARGRAPLTSTLQLAEILKQANPAWEKHKHPATRAFQGIRIFINDELGELERALAGSLECLTVGGRLVVISFHSLEDRMVKRFIQKQEKGDGFPPGVPVRQDQLNPRLRRVGKALKSTGEEVAGNVRARSAVMRAAEKIA